MLNEGILSARQEQSVEDWGGGDAGIPASTEQLQQRSCQDQAIPPAVGGLGPGSPRFSLPSSVSCCCLQLPRASKGEGEIRDRRSVSHTQVNPEEIRKQQDRFPSQACFPFPSPSSEIITEGFFPLLTAQYLIEDADL